MWCIRVVVKRAIAMVLLLQLECELPSSPVQKLPFGLGVDVHVILSLLEIPPVVFGVVHGFDDPVQRIVDARSEHSFQSLSYHTI